MTPPIAWIIDEKKHTPYILLDVFENDDGIVTWLHIRYYGDRDGLIALVSMAYAGLARVAQCVNDPEPPYDKTLWSVELDYGNS